MSREEAERRARIEFGGVEGVKEECRESRSFAAAAALLRDLRYGLRMLRRSPGFTAVAVISIALGVGANTAIFSIFEALLLRSLPVPHPQRLLQVQVEVNGRRSDSFSYPMIRALAERNDVFASLGGFTGNSFDVGPAEAPVRTPGAWVSGGFYAALELQPAGGRLLTPEDDTPGAPLVAVISDGYWERRYQRDPSAVGSVLLIEGQPTTIVGVTPPGFTGANVGERSDVTLAFQALPRLNPDRAGLLEAGNHFNRILARAAPGLSLGEARARLKALWPGIASVSVHAKTPPERRAAMLASTLDLVSGGTGWTPLRSQYARPLSVLMVISALVLLIACANVANLLLARSSARRREIAVRLAIGASRGRVVRQLLSESLLLAALGAALGIVLAQLGSRLLLQLVAEGPRVVGLGVGLNPQVLGFTVALTGLTGLLFGLAPALRATAAGGSASLQSGSRAVAGAGGRLASSLVAAQAALSLLALVGAGLFVQTLRNLQAVDAGFRHEGVLMLDVEVRRALRASGTDGDARIAAFLRESLDALSQVNGVGAVSVSNYTPVSGGFWSQRVLVDGRGMGEDEPPFFAVSPGFFATLQTRVVRGRDFGPRDDRSAPPVAIVNEEFLRRFIPDGDALGRRVSVADSPSFQDMEVVGVAANAIPYSLREPARPCVFVPLFQLPAGRLASVTFEIRAAGSLAGVATAVETVMRARLPGVPVATRSFTAQVESSIRREILMARLASFFGALALALGAVGLYGLLGYLVTQRTGEIGIRMALGARRGQVIRMVLGGGLRLVAIGLALGLPLVAGIARLVAGLLFDLSPTDAPTIAAAVAVLTATALAAGLLPARRASRVDPMTALRCE